MNVRRFPIFLTLFSILGFVALSFLFWLSTYQKSLFVSEIETNEKNLIEIASNIFKYGVESRFENILTLSDATQRLYDSSQKTFNLSVLTHILYALSKNARVYSKIRLIDTSGQELIRITRQNGKTFITPKNKLENNSHRDFFKQAFSHNHKIYVSPLNLSIENKRIVVPYKPILRLSSIIHAPKGEAIGLLVLSYLGDIFFNNITSATRGTFGKAFLINDAGYYLLAPDHNKEWGFILPGRGAFLFGKNYPKAWQAMQRNDRGSVFTPKGLFTYDMIRISSLAKDAQALGVELNAQESWKLVTYVPHNMLTPPWHGQMLAAGVGILILLLIAAWLWSGAYARRSLALQELEKSEQQLKTISTTAQDAIIMLNGQGKPVHWNPAAERLFGYQFSEIKDSFFHDLICPKELSDQTLEAWKQFSRTGSGPIVGTIREVTALRRDGSTVPVELGVAAILQDREWFTVGVARDISERKEYEASLHYEQEFLKAVLEYIQEGILVSDAQGQIILANQVARTLFGLAAEEQSPEIWATDLGKHFDILAADGKTPLAKEERPLHRIIQGENLQAMEIVLVTKKNERRTIIAGGRLLFDLKGREIGAVLSMKDVTDLVNARENARTAERAKSALLSRVGHEFKTPLNGILGLADLLLEDSLTLDQEDFIKEIKQSGNRLLRVLSLLIEYISIESGERHLHFQAIPLDLLMHGIEARWRSKIEQKNLEFSISSNITPLPTIHLDADCTNMILDQLLDNALKFTQEGSIALNVTVEETDALSYSVSITVTDTGIGIKRELRDKLFEKFWQEDVSYTRRYQGLGMGLTLAQGLVHLMGGKIWVGDSKQGCEIHVLLSPLECAL